MGNYQKALEKALDGLEIYSGDPRAQQYALKVQRKLKEWTQARGIQAN